MVCTIALSFSLLALSYKTAEGNGLSDFRTPFNKILNTLVNRNDNGFIPYSI